MTKVAAATKEAREEIKGVASMTVTSFFVTVLIVDFASLGLGKGFVCFGDFDEFLLDSLVTTGFVCVSWLDLLKPGIV